MRRVLDIIFSIFIFILVLPVLILVITLIKVDSRGSVFFKQKRIGLGGCHFYIYKFRTMIVGAEKIGTGLDSYEDDPRVTKLGRFLRNSSIDELPQLFNILIGDMSFIGPRPPTSYHPYVYDKYPQEQKKRFKVKPGVTGWAQVNGRNELNWDQKINLDLYYIKNRALLLDMKILYLTAVKVLKNENNYDLKGGNE
jgi:undecaprenyl phosphate N,N'-diacetylbacillosamine 1-phosphate transferase